MPGSESARPGRFGPYRLLERLGEGGMAEVWLASQEMEGVLRLLAVKRMHPELQADEGFVQMFLDELRIALELHHPNIGHIFDVGEIEGRYFLAMEHIEGRDLATVLQRLESADEFLPLEIWCEIGRKVAAALDHAHTRLSGDGRPRGIVHRDVSPDNVILTFDGQVKLVDFGIAVAEGRVARTQAGTLKGKPPYMAPEQILSEQVDARADLFSLGTLLYRAGTGRHPFAGSSPERVFHKVVEHTPRSMHRVEGDFPEELSILVSRLMEKDPADRPQSAETFLGELEALAARLELMISPKGMARWLLELFPEAADARAALSEDPFDEEALLTTSYHVTVGSPAVEQAHDPEPDEPEELPEPATVTAQALRPEPEPSAAATEDHEFEPATALATVPELAAAEEDEAPDDEPPEMATVIGARVPTPEDGGAEALERAATRFERIPEHRARGERPLPAPSGRPARDARRELPPEPDPGPILPLPPIPSRRAQPWSLEDHWNHLPAAYRSPAVLGAAALLAAALLFLAAVGLRTLLG
ncbi:MAG: serine/threonine-protein kinase [Deltaproteobacteria bacterium]|nr:serine/threonine-protein kinase [Deltaproteobacteria bacterium]